MIQMVSATEVKKWKCIQKILVPKDFGHKSYVQERLLFLQEGCARFCCFAWEMPKAVQERIFQESCARMFFCQIDVKRCAKEILSRELRKRFFLPERCQKQCKRNSFKRVVQERFFLPERCPGLHKIYCCPDNGAKERFTYFCFIWKFLKIIEQCFWNIFHTSLWTIS